MALLFRSRAPASMGFTALLAAACMCGTPSRADTCTNNDVQAAQANTATQADIQLMEQASTFVFGTVMDVAGAGSVESVFAAALGQGTSGASTDVVGAEIACQQTEITQITNEVAALQSNLANLAAQLANQVNADLANNIATDNQRLQTDVAALNPLRAGASNSAANFRTVTAPRAPGAPSSSPKVDLNTARVTAVDAQGLADLYMKQFQNRWIADDIDSKGASPTPHFEPYPALHTYFLALQVWMTAMSLEAADLGPSGLATIKAEYGADLGRHRDFLKSRANGGSGASSIAGDAAYDPLPDQITKQVACVWNLANPYPTGAGAQCTAYPTCSDRIQPQKVWKSSQTFSFAGTAHQMCQIDQGALPPIAELAQIQQHYGLNEVAKMEQIVDSMVRTGSMSVASAQPPSAPPGAGFGGTSTTPSISVYSVDAHGTVFYDSAVGSRSLGAPQPVTKGWSGLRALLPGGGNAFYTVDQKGVLDWYGFNNMAAAPAGPVQLASNFGNYRSVFGGGDGIIYAIGADGTLTWYRHDNLSAGGGPSALSAPKTVGSGWGQFSAVFSAGSGVIYALQPDGTLLWYRHLDYLTGDSLQAPAPQGSAAPVSASKGSSAARMLDQKVPARPQPHWQGPLKVATGWTGLRTLIAGGNGVILAVKSDGTVLWYKHDDYLAGQSAGAATPGPSSQSSIASATPAASAMPATFPTRNATAPNWGSAPSSAATPSWGQLGQNGGSAPSSWSTPSSLGAASSLGAPAGGASGSGAPGAVSALSRSRTLGGQVAPMAGTSGTAASPPSSLRSAAAAGASVTGAAAQAHFEGPITIGSGWQQYGLIAAVLPTTVNAAIH